LLLRVALGGAISIQGYLQLAGSEGAATWVCGVLGMAVGILLFAGFLTPIAAVLVALNAAGWWMAVIPVPKLTYFPSNFSVLFLATVAGVIVLLGPGAFSVDARLFGLREIIIPRSRSNGPVAS
jgi:uncharacterized membrane protein YphA (DoxX/SURF4 family)